MRTSPDDAMETDWEMDPRSDRGMNPEAYRGMGRAGYREQEPEAPTPAESHDLTLGMTALLGIFLAVVLVCAVFFGVGYSTGRTLHKSKTASASSVSPTGSETMASGAAAVSGTEKAAANSAISAGPDETAQGVAAPPLTAAPLTAKPSAGAPLALEDAVPRTPSPSSESSAQVSDGRAVYPAPTRRTASPSTANYSEAADKAPFPASRAEIAASAAGGVMVQIAAVVHPADADMLAHALRSNGYAATVHTEPQDKFLHVQVGPFATSEQAKAMRARLQADGYNAFLKP